VSVSRAKLAGPSPFALLRTGRTLSLRDQRLGEASGMKFVAVTSCPTGIAHTYMAAEALEQAAADAGDEIHVETQGSAGSDPLDPQTIAAADAVIFAADVEVRGRERFAGKPLVQSGVKRAIGGAAQMLDEARKAALRDAPSSARLPDTTTSRRRRRFGQGFLGDQRPPSREVGEGQRRRVGESRHEDRLFISYAREDDGKIRRLIKLLEDQGYYVWIDTSRTVGGRDWSLQVVEAIKAANALILVISDNSMRSDVVRKEVLYAESQRVKIIPVSIHPGLEFPDWYNFHFEYIHRIDALGRQGPERAVPEILAALRS
jgi:fructose-specific phosphotransferase system IIB component